MDLGALMRALERDPDDTGAYVAYARRRAQLEGADTYLEPLSDLAIWDVTPEPLQDLAAREVQRRLGDDYEYCGLCEWECPVDRVCRTCGRARSQEAPRACCEARSWGPSSYSHRVATLRDRRHDMELQLVPGWLESDQRWREAFEGMERGPTDVITMEEPSLIMAYGDVAPFLLARAPLTRAHFNRTAGSQGLPSPREMVFDDLPVCGVDPRFLKNWSKTYGFRQPSLREWYHACMAGADTQYYWGDSFDIRYVWCRETSGFCNRLADHVTQMVTPRPHPVGEHDGGPRRGIAYVSFDHRNEPLLTNGCQGWHKGDGSPDCPRRPHHHHDERCRPWVRRTNAFGFVDMIGNVWEPCGERFFMGGSYAAHSHRIQEALQQPPTSLPTGSVATVGYRIAVTIPM